MAKTKAEKHAQVYDKARAEFGAVYSAYFDDRRTS